MTLDDFFAEHAIVVSSHDVDAIIAYHALPFIVYRGLGRTVLGSVDAFREFMLGRLSQLKAIGAQTRTARVLSSGPILRNRLPVLVKWTHFGDSGRQIGTETVKFFLCLKPHGDWLIEMIEFQHASGSVANLGDASDQLH